MATTDVRARSSRNQLLAGVLLLAVGVLLAAGLALGKATVAAGIGYAICVAGVVFIVNSLMVRRRAREGA